MTRYDDDDDLDLDPGDVVCLSAEEARTALRLVARRRRDKESQLDRETAKRGQPHHFTVADLNRYRDLEQRLADALSAMGEPDQHTERTS
jgi:hypothetical protein